MHLLEERCLPIKIIMCRLEVNTQKYKDMTSKLFIIISLILYIKIYSIIMAINLNVTLDLPVRNILILIGGK